MSVSSAGNPSGHASASFEIKSAQLPLVALLLKTNDLDVLAADLAKQFGAQGDSSDFFDSDAVVIDFSQLAADLPVQDLAPLLTVLRSCRLVPVAVRGANAAWMESARAFGLAEAPPDAPRVRPVVATPEIGRAHV